MSQEISITDNDLLLDLTFFGNDSTAVNTVITTTTDKLDKSLAKFNTDRIPKASTEIESELARGVELLKKAAEEGNRQINSQAARNAERGISIGKSCNKLKDMTKRIKISWEVWAAENLSFIHERNRQKYMRLAKRTDCHKFFFLGLERLDCLCAATKDVEKFMAKHQINIDFSAEFSLEEFRVQVDAALNVEKLEQRGLAFNPQDVKNLTVLGVDFDEALLKRLYHIKEADGKPEKFLEMLSANKGQEPKDPSVQEKRIQQDFNTLASRLSSTITSIINGTVQADKVDIDTLSKLESMIQKLREIVDVTEAA